MTVGGDGGLGGAGVRVGAKAVGTTVVGIRVTMAVRVLRAGDVA